MRRRGPKPQYRERDERLAATYTAGKTLRECSGLFDLSPERIRQILRRQGVQMRAQGSGK